MVDLVTTYLEMSAPPAGEPLLLPCDGITVAAERPSPEAYLALYREIGHALQWDSRSRMPVSALASFLAAPTSLIFILRENGVAIGLCEFDRVGSSDVELTHFGIVESVYGRRLGPCLLDRGLRACWHGRPDRIWLHTDTNDHPKAIPTYERAGFRPYRQQVETFPD